MAIASNLIVSAPPLRAFVADLLARVGVPEPDAAFVAETLVESNLRGVDSHGVLLLTMYLPRFAAGTINFHPQIRTIREGPATALLDADHALGQVSSRMAMMRAIELARASGVGVVGVRNAYHFGAAAYWTMMALPHGMIGAATANADPRVAPYGGIGAALGTNPWSWAIPAGRELPVVLDMATSVVALGKMKFHLYSGQPIPEGWALDAEGRPTTDPADVFAGGVGLPFGGYKGYGFAVVAELLSGALMGAWLGHEAQPLPTSEQLPNLGHCFLAIDVARFMPLDQFGERVDRLIRSIKATRRAPGVEEILLPGEREFRTRAERLERGIPLPAQLVDELSAWAHRFGATTPW